MPVEILLSIIDVSMVFKNYTSTSKNKIKNHPIQLKKKKKPYLILFSKHNLSFRAITASL